MISGAPGPMTPLAPSRVIGRYALFGQIAAGGMAVVHIGRLLGPVGFARTVAIKQLHSQFACNPEFVAMFLDEARLAARIRHPNVVATLDVVVENKELFLVMEYVQGESFARLLRCAAKRETRFAPAIIVNVMLGVLAGLHAAHEATTEQGTPLGLVHRDVSPQNVIVGVDGVARVLDFGVAKAVGRAQLTRDGELKGKIPYMSPEQILGRPVDRRSDVYACAVLLWEALTLRRLFAGDTDAEVLHQVLERSAPPIRTFSPEVSRELEAVVMRGLARDPERRYATALEMAVALEQTTSILSPRELGVWVRELAGDTLAQREIVIEGVERGHTPSLVTARLDEPSPLSMAKTTAQIAAPDTMSLTMKRVMPRAAIWTVRLSFGVGIACMLFAGGMLLWHSYASQSGAEPPPSVGPISVALPEPPASSAVDPSPSVAPTATATAPAIASAAPSASASATPSATPVAHRSTPPPQPQPQKGPLEHRSLYKRE